MTTPTETYNNLFEKLSRSLPESPVEIRGVQEFRSKYGHIWKTILTEQHQNDEPVFQEKFDALFSRIQNLLEDLIVSLIDQSESDSGLDSHVDGWIDLCQEFDFLDAAQRLRDIQVKARNKRLIRNLYDDAQNIYLEVQRFPQQEGNPEAVLNVLESKQADLGKILKNVDLIVRDMQYATDVVEKHNKLHDWAEYVDSEVSNVRRRTTNTATLAQTEEYAELSELIDEIAEENKQQMTTSSRLRTVRSFITDDLDDNSLADLSPEKAQEILSLRWIKYSIEKYTHYIDMVKQSLQLDEPFSVDPADVETEFNRNLHKNLRPMNQLGVASNQIKFKMAEARSLIEKAKRAVQSLHDRIENTSRQVVPLEGLDVLRQLRLEVEQLAPCLLEKYQEQEEVLTRRANEYVERAWKHAQELFRDGTLLEVEQYCNDWTTKLDRWAEFSTDSYNFRLLAKLALDVRSNLEKLPKNDPIAAIAECKEIVAKIENHELNVARRVVGNGLIVDLPIELSRTMLTLDLDAIILRGEAILPDSRDDVIASVTSQVEEVIELIDKGIGSAGDLQKDKVAYLSSLLEKLTILVSYCNARDEFAAEGANLENVQENLSLVQGSDWLANLLGESLSDFAVECQKMIDSRPEIESIVHLANEAFENRANGSIADLIDLYAQILITEKLPSTRKLRKELYEIRVSIGKYLRNECEIRLEAVARWASAAVHQRAAHAIENIPQSNDAGPERLFEWLKKHYPNHSVLKQTQGAIEIFRAIQKESIKEWESAKDYWQNSYEFLHKDDDDTWRILHVRAVACLKLTTLKKTIERDYSWITLAKKQDLLENDRQIHFASLRRDIDQLQKMVENPTQLRKERQLRGVVTVETRIDPLQKALELAPVGSSLTMDEVWSRYGYAQDAPPGFTEKNLQDKIDELQHIYLEFFRITHKIDVGRTLRSLRSGKILVEHVLSGVSSLPTSEKDRLSKLWELYRNNVLIDFHAGMFSDRDMFLQGRLKRPDLYAQLCIWVLDPAHYINNNQHDLDLLNVVVLNFIRQDLYVRHLELTDPLSYGATIQNLAPKVDDIDAKLLWLLTHQSKLQELLEDEQDLEAVLMDYVSFKQLNACRIMLSEAWDDGKLTTGLLFLDRQACDIIDTFANYSKELKRRLQGSNSLLDQKGKLLKQIEKEWRIVCVTLKTRKYPENSTPRIDFSAHPTIDWVKDEIREVRDLRRSVQQKINHVRITYDLDQKHGKNWLELCPSVEIVETETLLILDDCGLLDDESKQASLFNYDNRDDAFWEKDALENFCRRHKELGWISFALHSLEELTKEDKKNLTSWQDLVSYGEYKGLDATREYLLVENEQTLKTLVALEQFNNLHVPALPESFEKMLRKGDYESALVIWSRWVGSQVNLLSELTTIDSWLKSIMADVNTIIVQPSNDKDQSLIKWACLLFAIIRGVDIPDKAASKARRDYYADLQSIYDYVTAEFGKALKSLQSLEKLWKRFRDGKVKLSEAETNWLNRNWLSKLLSFIRRGEPPELQMVKVSLVELYAIAPENESLLKKMNLYKCEVPKNSSTARS